MFKGFYLDQLNTPAPQTPVGVTPPPELMKNSVIEKSVNVNNDDNKTERSVSRKGSTYSQQEYASVSMKKTLTIDIDGSTNKDIEI